jgi:hypothetical protein
MTSDGLALCLPLTAIENRLSDLRQVELAVCEQEDNAVYEHQPQSHSPRPRPHRRGPVHTTIVPQPLKMSWNSAGT